MSSALETRRARQRGSASTTVRHDPSPLARYARNPILTPEQMPVECSAVFNCGAVNFRGKVLLLMRVEDYSRQTNFYVATSDDGVHFDVLNFTWGNGCSDSARPFTARAAGPTSRVHGAPAPAGATAFTSIFSIGRARPSRFRRFPALWLAAVCGPGAASASSRSATNCASPCRQDLQAAFIGERAQGNGEFHLAILLIT